MRAARAVGRVGAASLAVALLPALLHPAAGSAADDPTPPETTVTSGPRGLIVGASASFGFTSDQPGSTFECRLDGGTWTLRARASAPAPQHVFVPGWESCSSPKSYSGLADGSHGFEVRATSTAGITDPTPASRSFTVDTRVAATISAKRSQGQRGRRVRVEIEVTAQEGIEATFEGRIRVRRARKGGRGYELGPKARHLSAGETQTLRLRPRRERAERRIARALRRGRRARAKVTVRLRGEHRDAAIRRVVVELRKGGRR